MESLPLTASFLLISVTKKMLAPGWTVDGYLKEGQNFVLTLEYPGLTPQVCV